MLLFCEVDASVKQAENSLNLVIQSWEKVSVQLRIYLLVFILYCVHICGSLMELMVNNRNTWQVFAGWSQAQQALWQGRVTTQSALSFFPLQQIYLLRCLLHPWEWILFG